MIYDSVEPADLAARIGAPRCVSFASVTSTLDIVHQMAEEAAPSGTVVLAEEQVAGRGRFGRAWHSPARAGIWMGYLARPRTNVGVGVLSLRVGLVIARVLDEMAVRVQLKWPNDIMLVGRKLGGVLCEARWLRDRIRWIAVGIGLNVRGRLPAEMASRAISLDEALPAVTRIQVLQRLVPSLCAMPESPILTREEREEYSCRDWLWGRTLREPVAGEAAGIDQAGALLVRVDDRVERVVGGSVVAT